MNHEFTGKHVIVTGGTGALGAAVVARLAAAGAHCHVPHRGESAGPSSDSVSLYPDVELSNQDAVDRLYSKVPKLWASIHIAGGFAMSPISKTHKAALLAQLETNLISCFLCCRAAVSAFGDGEGRIVNVAARPALEPRTGAGMTAYSASKAGVAALTVALAEEVARQNILVNAVAPSILDTPANRASMPKADPTHWPKVEEVAATITFLASPENKVTRGAIVPVYGQS